MSMMQPSPEDYPREQVAEIIPFPRDERNIIVRFGGVVLAAAKIVLLGPDYTDKI